MDVTGTRGREVLLVIAKGIKLCVGPDTGSPGRVREIAKVPEVESQRPGGPKAALLIGRQQGHSGAQWVALDRMGTCSPLEEV